MKTTKVYCQKASDIPIGTHWAIIEEVQFHIPGDERSRTHPGHGYPARTEQAFNYVAYIDPVEFESDLKVALHQEGLGYRHHVRGIHVVGSFTHQTSVVLTEVR